MQVLENQTTKDKQDSLFYDGVVMRVRYKNREWCLVACGEIKINHKDLGRVLPEDVANTDKELYKLIDDGLLEIDSDNWYEVNAGRDAKFEPEFYDSFEPFEFTNLLEDLEGTIDFIIECEQEEE
tara:strand:+ start:271 stop:645 length:375 start_codon:yes stop_codon:yes gene_type:complete